jgi:hypothetical protein
VPYLAKLKRENAKENKDRKQNLVPAMGGKRQCQNDVPPEDGLSILKRWNAVDRNSLRPSRAKVKQALGYLIELGP